MIRNKVYRSAFSAILLALLASVAPAQEGQADRRDKELPNFHEVNARLFRGGQPKAGGLRKLAARGVKTVINLRDDDARAVEEEREAKSLGMRYFNVPLSRAGRPSVERVEQVLALIDSTENQPVFLHCQRGADRTGVVVAAYRVKRDHWTSERAIKEADEYGMGWWQRGKRDFVKDYFKQLGPAAGEGASPNANQNANANRKLEHDTKKPDAKTRTRGTSNTRPPQ